MSGGKLCFIMNHHVFTSDKAIIIFILGQHHSISTASSLGGGQQSVKNTVTVAIVFPSVRSW